MTVGCAMEGVTEELEIADVVPLAAEGWPGFVRLSFAAIALIAAMTVVSGTPLSVTNHS